MVGLFEILIVGLVLVILVSLITNQVLFAVALMIFSFVALVVYLWTQKKSAIKPVEELKSKLRSQCAAPDIAWGALILGGDVLHQERTRGQIYGYTVIRLEPKEAKLLSVKEAEEAQADTHKLPKEPKPRARVTKAIQPYLKMYCIMYCRAAFGFIDKIVLWIRMLPILNRFLMNYNFLLVTEEQLFGKDAAHPLNRLTGGDIKLGFHSITNVGFFEVLNVAELNKDVINGEVKIEVDRITLYYLMNEQAETINKAIESDAFFEKEKALNAPGDYGIQRR